MVTVGSITRHNASQTFAFLTPKFSGRRKAIRQLTHTYPEFVFWIYPDGRLLDARQSHCDNPPTGYEHILDDEPEYGGFLRGRVARWLDTQIIVIYCQPEALASDTVAIKQLLAGIAQMPIPIEQQTLIISDNGDMYGTVADLKARLSAQ